MDDVINLLQNDPLAFLLLAIFAVIIIALFIFSAYLHLIPTSIAQQYKQLRNQPIVYFGTIGIFLALLVIVLVLSFGSPKQEVETREATFMTEGKITAVDSTLNIVTIQQTGSVRTFKFKIGEEVTYKQAWSDKSLTKDDLAKGVVVEVLSYKTLKAGEISQASNISQVTIFPDLNTLPPDSQNLPDYEVEGETGK